jgi:hypothetical protein
MADLLAVPVPLTRCMASLHTGLFVQECRRLDSRHFPRIMPAALCPLEVGMATVDQAACLLVWTGGRLRHRRAGCHDTT